MPLGCTYRHTDRHRHRHRIPGLIKLKDLKEEKKKEKKNTAYDK